MSDATEQDRQLAHRIAELQIMGEERSLTLREEKIWEIISTVTGPLREALAHAHLYFIQSNNLTVDDREMLDEMWAALHPERILGGTV